MSEISNVDVSDEDLMAFSDGELAGDQHARVAKIVANSEAAAQRLAAFAATGRRLSGLFEQPMQEPVPQRLMDTVRGHADKADTPAFAGKVIRMDARGRARPMAAKQYWFQAAAACAGLVLLGAGVQALMNGRNAAAEAEFALADAGAGQHNGVRLAGGELAAALDVAPSGSSAVRAIAGTDAAIKPVFTFASANGYCRQYTIARVDAAASYAGVACRETDGRWRIEVHEKLAGSIAKNGQIVVAGKGGLATIDAAVDKLISGSVLGAEDEAALLKDGWSMAKP